jgi:bifunctional non-homologous end joining protein LigD
MYPAVGFTKGEVIDFYTRVAPVLLPHLHGRPLTLKRYPNGVDDKFFYEKNCPSHRPDWVRTAHVGEIDYCLCDDLATLVWMANLADLELHPSLSLAEPIAQPTVMAFDLDPGAPAGIMECRDVAFLLRDALRQIGLECFPKTSGSKGIQVYAPLNSDGVTYDDTKPLSQALARHLEAEHPKLIVSLQKKELRKGKVLIDWSQNDEHKTTVSVYSLRARERPTVSTPVGWDELEAATERDDLAFTAEDVLARVEEHGDLFAPVVELEQQLPDL